MMHFLLWRFPQLLHESKRDFAPVVARLDIRNHLNPKMSRHFGICQCPVMYAICLQTLIAHQRLKLVVRSFRIDPPRNQHGTGKFVASPVVNPAELSIEEFGVE